MIIPSITSPNVLRLVNQLRNEKELNEQNLNSILVHSEITRLDVGWFVEFSRHNYTRNMVFENDRLQVLLLGWKPGQQSPVHNHGVSCCGVRVIAGIATETVYPSAVGENCFQQLLHPGQVVAKPGSHRHQIANLGNENLVTLHVYAPRLLV